MSKIADSNRKHVYSGGVNANKLNSSNELMPLLTNDFDVFNLAEEFTTQQRSPDEQQIALFLSQSETENNARSIDISN